MQPRHDPTSAAGRAEPELRTEIQALRAVAVVSVLLYHLWPDRLTGGYVGVDVFFVISGFLITGHLLRELDRTGSLRVGQFWARRAKRLLPASLTVLALVAIATLVVAPASVWPQFYREIIASTLYVQNWQLAASAVDYLAAGNAGSPVQHFWTLSAEEQFYIVLPLIVLGAAALSRLGRRRTRPVVFVSVAVATGASLGASVWFTATTPDIAYFATYTRAWEFGAGALLAFAPAWLARPALRIAMGWLGIAAIAATCLLYTAATPFPGVAAALPVAGTLAVLAAGHSARRASIAGLGRLRPVSLAGRISYAIYLWHWPLIVLVPFALGRPLGVVDKVAIIVLAFALAWLSTRFLEEPVRFSPRLLGGKRRARTVMAASAAGMAVVIGLSGIGLVTFDRTRGASDRAIAHLLAGNPRCLGAQAMDPALAPCVNPDLDGVLIPQLDLLGTDDGNRPECWGVTDNEMNICHLGPTTGYAKKVLAVGDSHNNALIPAYEKAAQLLNWRIDVTGLGGCYWSDAELIPDIKDNESGCARWRAGITDYLDGSDYDAVIATGFTKGSTVEPADGLTAQEAAAAGLAHAWQGQLDRGRAVIAINDLPHILHETVDCFTDKGLEAATECTVSRAEAFDNFDAFPPAAELAPGAQLIDLSDLLCSPTRCNSVIGHVVVYRDLHHLTGTFAATLGPYLAQRLEAAMHAWAEARG